MPGDTGDRAGPGDGGLDPLYREVRRIREIAESRSAADGRRRVAELTDYVPSSGRDGFTLWVAIVLGRLAQGPVLHAVT